MSHASLPTRIATLVVVSMLLPVAAYADIIGPGSGPRRPPGPPTPPPAPPEVQITEKIRKAGFDCSQLNVYSRDESDTGAASAQPGLVRYNATCSNGKQFSVVLSNDSQDERGSVQPKN